MPHCFLCNNFLSDVWFIGDSLVHHAEEAAVAQGNSNLHLQNGSIIWLGKSGMHWDQLQDVIQLEMLNRAPPAMIVIHLGGNDLVEVKQATLIKKISKDMAYINSIFP